MYRFVESLIDPLPEQAVRRPPTGTLDFFRFFLNPVRGVLITTLVLSGIAAVSELFVYIYLGRILDWMNETERGDFLDTHATQLVLMFVVVVIIRPVSAIATRALINLALIPGLGNATRWQNHRYVLRQSMSFFQNDFAGRVAQKVVQTGYALREAVINVIDGIWMLLIYIVGIVAFLLDANRQLVWPMLLWIIAYGCVILIMVPPVRVKSARLSQANSDVMGRIVDSYTNIQSVKLFAHHSEEENFVAQGILQQTHDLRVLMRAVLGMFMSLTVLNTLLVAGTVGLSVYLWLQEAVTVGEVAVAAALVFRLNQMSGWVLRTITSLFEQVGTVQNGIETISQAQDVIDQPHAKQLVVDQGKIIFDKVSFSYGKASKASMDGRLVEQCSFVIQPGEKIGLVGRSGAGKSTLINLLMRFHDVESGSIRIDNQDISELTQESLRSAIAVVTQDTSLLHRSVRDNIAYGRPDATEADVRRAAQQAEAMTFIEELTDPNGRRGLDAHVGERGVKLSGGQRQRIAIARVILKDAPVLILDEATSALDSEVEADIQEQLTQLMQGKTVLAVAHRLSTIAALDRLIVLDKGRIVEQGDHQSLIASDGLYARLWQRQSGGFIGVD